jgi:hypothetical protein
MASGISQKRNAPSTKHGRGVRGENGEFNCETESGRPVRNGGIRRPLRRLDPAQSSAADSGRTRRWYASPSVCRACVAKVGCSGTWRTTTWGRKRSRKKIEAQVIGFKFGLKECRSKAAETISALKAVKFSPPRTEHQPFSGKRCRKELQQLPGEKNYAIQKVFPRTEHG